MQFVYYTPFSVYTLKLARQAHERSTSWLDELVISSFKRCNTSTFTKLAPLAQTSAHRALVEPVSSCERGMGIRLTWQTTVYATD